MQQLNKFEPAMVRGLVTSLVMLLTMTGVVTLTDVQAEALSTSAEQVAAGVAALLAVVLPIVQGYSTRQQVTPVDAVNDAVDSAIVEAETAAADMDAEPEIGDDYEGEHRA